MIAFLDDEFSELILHPAPVSLLAVLMLPLMAIKPCIKHVNRFFSYLIFWLENIVLLTLFFLYEILLAPFVAGKIFFNLMTNSFGLFTTIFYCIYGLILL